MGFAILRTAKLKSMGAIGASLSHTFRTRETPNADATRTPENSHQGAHDPEEAKAAIRALLPEKRRSDAVLAVEYLVTGSPEVMDGKSRQQQDAYFADAAAWLKERHGAENVVYTGVHRDETTPHLVAYVVPLDAATGRLNAKKWLGGKQALTAMQTDFAERVGRAHGLERGIEGSRAKHQTVRQFYAGIEAEAKQPRLTVEAIAPKVVEKGIFSSKVEDPETVAERLTGMIHRHYAPQLAVAGNAKADRKRAAELVQTAQRQAVKLGQAKPMMELFAGLKPEQVAEVAKVAREHQRKNRIEVEAQRRVDQLASLVKRTAGAAHTFARKALDAIKVKAGEWRRVDWPEVEKDTIRETVHEHGQSRVSAFRAVLEHSPGAVGVSEKQVAALLDRAAKEDLAAGLKPEPPKRDRGPSLGR